jgi:serine/threonine protein kinase
MTAEPEPQGSQPTPPGKPAAANVLALMIDQRRRAQRGAPLRVETYLEKNPGLGDDREGLLDLIYNEIILREGRGESPAFPEYQERFPHLAAALGDLFEVHRAIEQVTEDSCSDAGGGTPSVELAAGALRAVESTSPHAPATTTPGPALAQGPGWPVLEGYEILDVLGSGGMGVVYRAKDRRRGVSVAVKTMRQTDAAALYRFKHEFRALLDVSHPNLVTLHELISDGRAWFIVMELVDGETFLNHVRGGIGLQGDARAGPPGLSDELPASQEPTAGPPGDPWATETGHRAGELSHGPARRHPAAAGLGAEALARLRRGLRQLAAGLEALHQAGKLHRDIKPTNVMVTRQGRVVVMDFGLVAEAARPGRDPSTEGHLVGTAGYMAPEQAAGLRVSPASDWYSVGVMLYQALTGRLPFLGQALQVLMDKQAFEPLAPRDLVVGIPEDLNALCVDLLRRDARARPSGREVLSRLGAVADDGATVAPGEPATVSHGELPFVGRASHRAALDNAMAAMAQGRTVVVFVHGRSGVGKTALVETFLGGLAGQGEAVVLSGRCYERESVPYKALDSLIDALSHYLHRLPPHEAEALLPRDVAALVRVFPVLRRVDAVAAAPRRGSEAPDPQELRRRAFSALRELLARLGDRRPLVLAIDDLQWGDFDSMAVLSEILRPPDPPVLLLLACYREEDAADNAFIRAALAAPSSGSIPEASTVERRDLAVGPLSPDEARLLAAQLLGISGLVGDMQAEVVARESGGNPFFVAELARAVQAGRPGRTAGGDDRGPIALDEVLWSRVTRLPDDARRLLEVVAVSGGPLGPDVAWRCLERPGDMDERATFALLRSARLVRSASGPSRASGEWVETYHDRVRETVVAHLAPAMLGDCHRRLARALEACGGADPEVLGMHFEGAGEPEQAAEHFARAASRAAEALAFERASALYRRALELRPAVGADGRRLRASLGEALASAGRGAEAARTFLAACDGATVAEARELRRRAAMQFLVSGHIDQGLDALRDVLAAVGMTLPRTPRRALISLLFHRARIRLRGLTFHPRDTSEISPADLTRIDICWSAGIGLSNVDWIRGADFQARGLLLALRAGEPFRVARALAVEAAQTATAGQSARRRTARLLDTAGVLARTSDQPYALGMVALVTGVAAYLEARWRDSLAACDRAEAVFRDRCIGVPWELDTAHAYSLWALSHMGHWAELSRRFPMLINEARERGDLYAAMNLSTYILSVVRLAADEPDAALEEIRWVIGQWSGAGYHVQHNDQVWALVQIELYQGNGPAAWDRITRHWPTLARSLLLRVQFIRVAMLGLRARCALAAASAMSPSSSAKSAYFRSAARDAARLERERLPWASAQAKLIRAGLAACRGYRDEAVAHLRAASAQFRECEMGLWASVADRRLGSLLGGDEGRMLIERSDAWLAAEAVRRPDRIADQFAPGI